VEALEAIARRRSIRVYTGDPVQREHLAQIVDAGRLAASGNNRQPWDFIVITDRSTIVQLRVVAGWLQKAGAVIAVVMDPASRWWVEDGAAAVQNMLIATTALGYGSCWLEGYSLQFEERLKILLNVPPGRRLTTLVAVGASTDRPQPDKKKLDQVLHWEKF
jgi:nitroreductase